MVLQKQPCWVQFANCRATPYTSRLPARSVLLPTKAGRGLHRRPAPSESATASFDSLPDVKSAFALLLTKVTKLETEFILNKDVISIRKTISFSVGKGSLAHNRREFIAQNVDSDRTQMNIEYCNENLEQVYHQMFDDALQRFNDKQKRADRKIESYYDKIRTGKQEKLFHEVIVQIGNREDTNSKSADSEIAVRILDEYMKHFQERNPNLRIFSAHLHLDEETPHLHIDFVPFVTNSKRGLDTRVSLKQALLSQGFKGESKFESEWSKWALSEKQQLASVMEKHGVEWEQLGTHNEHLSVYDYKKKMRAEEVQELEEKAESLTEKINDMLDFEVQVESFTNMFYDEEEYKLPEPSSLMSAKAYKTKIVEPLFNRIISLAKTAVKMCFELKAQVENLKLWGTRDKNMVKHLTKENDALYTENQKLHKEVKEFKLLKCIFGEEKISELVKTDKETEKAQRKSKSKKYERNR